MATQSVDCYMFYSKDFPISVHPDSAICQSVQYLPAATRPHLKNFDLTIVLPDVLLTPNPLLLPHTRSNPSKDEMSDSLFYRFH